jgi:hypothetical protein
MPITTRARSEMKWIGFSNTSRVGKVTKIKLNDRRWPASVLRWECLVSESSQIVRVQQNFRLRPIRDTVLLGKITYQAT